jgi:GDPmannose 4,6-dehydratase
MAKKAFITGITGQDGSYLCELLLSKGYEIHGLIRRSSSFNMSRINAFCEDPRLKNARLFLHYGDLTDGTSLSDLARQIMPDEVYNLAAQSNVRVSFDVPVYTVQACAIGTLHLLEALRSAGSRARFCQASSSEMFGLAAETPQTERTAFHPRSPYGCAKVFSYWQTVNYREAYGMFACNAIMFNHESPRRGEPFVTRKITRAATRIKEGLQEKLFLGNLDARRDWGYAGDYVQALWQMLQQDAPDDYVIATGETHSVRDFVEEVFGLLDLDWRKYVELDPYFLRPAEVQSLQGDASKAREKLGWTPTVRFKELARVMVEHDWCLARDEAAAGNGRPESSPYGAR